ncbi:LPS assembly lipoprotein LptE [Bisgaard Taxon 10/6]|uniref:LPS-assembly lipoprotein LptE n=1 Tax=Exercitatus varius TaxID=67857 RepID=A0ABT6EPC0_9PAST|nr:LPS assembly lipoprotein LptE [Exercitatus varius]MDG2939947.1 LPS assembly lipoprotein LptE [Exercitatus varius]MDG2945382.1 LPS assembly lipoprotein LptE [Exercitatus varius]
MFKHIKNALFLTALFGLSACGFHFQTGQLVPAELQTLTFESGDPYSDMSMAMRRQLQLNNIKLVDAAKDVPVLRITKITTDDEVVSVFKQGREAEKMLMLDVSASVRFPNKDAYPISTRVNRTFFDNSRAALAKSSEKEIMWRDMREQAARQLISKMVALQHQVEAKPDSSVKTK